MEGRTERGEMEGGRRMGKGPRRVGDLLQGLKRDRRPWEPSYTHCCRALTLALARLSC